MAAMLGYQKNMVIKSRVQQHGDRIMPWFGVCEANKRWNIGNESTACKGIVIMNDVVVE